MSSSTCSTPRHFCYEHVQRTSLLRRAQVAAQLGIYITRRTHPRAARNAAASRQVLCTYLVPSSRSCSSTAVRDEAVGLFSSSPLENGRSLPVRSNKRKKVSSTQKALHFDNNDTVWLLLCSILRHLRSMAYRSYPVGTVQHTRPVWPQIRPHNSNSRAKHKRSHTTCPCASPRTVVGAPWAEAMSARQCLLWAFPRLL